MSSVLIFLQASQQGFFHVRGKTNKQTKKKNYMTLLILLNFGFIELPCISHSFVALACTTYPLQQMYCDTICDALFIPI